MPETHDVTSETGYKVRVSVPKGKSTRYGIPLSVDFEALAEQFNLEAETAQSIQRDLWAGGIVTPRDFRTGKVYDELYGAIRRHLGLERKDAARLGTQIINHVRNNL